MRMRARVPPTRFSTRLISGSVSGTCSRPVRRGRRFGVFTFLHDESRDAQYRGMLAEQKARGGLGGIRMRLAALLLPASQFCELAEMVVTIV